MRNRLLWSVSLILGLIAYLNLILLFYPGMILLSCWNTPEWVSALVFMGSGALSGWVLRYSK